MRTNAILTFLVVAITILTFQCDDVSNKEVEYSYEDYIEQIATDNPSFRWKAFKRLFTGGKDAIPVLLRYALDTRITHLSLYTNPVSSSPPSEEETRLTVGTACLYLIESIKTGVKEHSKPRILYSELILEEEKQKRAYEAYLKWWQSVKDNKTFKRDFTEIVPWKDYLGTDSVIWDIGYIFPLNILGSRDPDEVVKRLEDTNPHMRRLAIRGLFRLKERDSASEIIKRINDTHPRVRVTAIHIFKYWKVKEAVPAITERLKDEDARVRRQAIETLHSLDAQETLPEIIKRLDDDDLAVRRSAIKKVGLWGDQEVIPLITQKLEDANAYIRHDAVEALGKLGAKESIPQIMTMLNDGHSSVRTVAVKVLADLDAQEALPEIVKMLDDVEGYAMLAIAKLDVQEKKSVPELLKRLKSRNWRVRWTALILLGRLKAHEAIPQIIGMLNDQYYSNRHQAIIVLEELEAREATPEIIKCLKDSHKDVRIRARKVLEKWGVEVDACGCLGWEALILAFIVVFIKKRQRKSRRLSKAIT